MSELFDVVIVGAGLSGIGAACYLARAHPNKRVALLEGRASLGGTWDLFRYPGIRSDSDMFTLGYNFEPWLGRKAIADGSSIKDYIADVARKYGVEQKIRYRHRVKSATWSSERCVWTLDVDREGESVTIEARFLWMCAGYYNYEQGYTPEFPGRERFQGTIVHPQHWPENIDYANKRIVVIGSGATAVTLVPALAKTAKHVVMLQRTPTYMLTLPEVDPIAQWFRKRLPTKQAYQFTRAKNVLLSMAFYQLARRAPERVRAGLKQRLKQAVGPSVDVEKHFNPPYNPWDQRVCVVPNDDFFVALREGRTSVVTEHIETFTEKGIKLRSGEELEADIIVTATGLDLLFLGGMKLAVDGKALEIHDLLYYKGCMLGGVPNLALTFGYVNASWTLKADLVADYVCRVLQRMEEKGAERIVPKLDPSVKPQPFVELSSGYIRRAMDRVPQQGNRRPWTVFQNYFLDAALLKWTALDDGVLEFSRSPATKL